MPGDKCILSLDDGLAVQGTVKSGVMLVRPTTVSLDVALELPNGGIHLVQTGAWSGERRVVAR